MERKKAAEDLIKKYFIQLTKGCGREPCDNEFCASSGKSKNLSKDEAAALAIGLLFKKARLCIIQDPVAYKKEVGLSKVKLFEIVELCKESSDFKPLVRLIGQVFSSSDLLNKSFLLQNIPSDNRIPVDQNQVESSYHCLFSLDDPLLDNALINALTSLGSAIEIDLQTNSNKKTAAFVNQFIVIFLNPCLSDPKYLMSAVPSILTATSLLPTSLQKVLVEYFSLFDNFHLKQILHMLHQFITIKLLTVDNENDFPVNDDKNIIAATKCMKLVYYACIAGGKFDRPFLFIKEKTTAEAGILSSSIPNDEENDQLLEELKINVQECREPLIPYHEFVNDLLNEKIEMDRDFANYKYGQPRFSFLNYSFILHTATKSLGLYYDNRVRMYSERRITILLGLMQGSLDSFNSPYLRLRVRRNHLIEDALVRLEIIARDSPSDFKKQLIVEFDGEQGVDEGGVSKEFFQLVVEQLFNADYENAFLRRDSNAMIRSKIRLMPF